MTKLRNVRERQWARWLRKLNTYPGGSVVVISRARLMRHLARRYGGQVTVTRMIASCRRYKL